MQKYFILLILVFSLRCFGQETPHPSEVLGLLSIKNPAKLKSWEFEYKEINTNKFLIYHWIGRVSTNVGFWYSTNDATGPWTPLVTNWQAPWLRQFHFPENMELTTNSVTHILPLSLNRNMSISVQINANTRSNFYFYGGYPPAAAPSNPPTATNGLIARWDFEGDGAVIRDSAGENHGAIMGGERVQPGKIGNKAFKFNGETDYILINNQNLNLTNEITISVWIKPDENPNPSGLSGRIVSMGNSQSGDNWSLEIQETREWGGRINNRGWDQTDDFLPAGEWSHIAMTYDGQFRRYYRDGELVGEFSQTGGISSGETIRIGRNGTSDSARLFAGELDDVQIYDRALTKQEIINDTR